MARALAWVVVVVVLYGAWVYVPRAASPWLSMARPGPSAVVNSLPAMPEGCRGKDKECAQ